MKRYEYKLVEHGFSAEERLNELAKEGWRFVGVTPAAGHYGAYVAFLMERSVEVWP